MTRDQRLLGASPSGDALPPGDARTRNTSRIAIDTWVALLRGEITLQRVRIDGRGTHSGIAPPDGIAPPSGTPGIAAAGDAPRGVPPEQQPVTDKRRRRQRRVSRKAERFKAVCETYGNVCLCCGRGGKPLTIDHVVPVSKGGSNHSDNWQPLCQRCNSRKGVDSTDYRTPPQSE